MGAVDDYLRHQVTPQLRPGEQIMGMGLMRHPTKFNLAGLPERYDEWLATATNRRLILFKTDVDWGSTLTPKPMCQEVREWHFMDLARVHVEPIGGLVNGLNVYLAPRDGMGPLDGQGSRYDLWPKVAGLDAHADFFQRFPHWLSQQVAAGAFPLDQEGMARAQAIAMQRQQQAAVAQQQQAMAAQARSAQVEKGKQALRGPLPWLVGAGLLFLASAGALFGAYQSYDRVDFYEKMAKDSEGYAKSSAYDEAEQGRQKRLAKEHRETAKSAGAMVPVYGGAGGVLLIGAVALAVLGLKKRKA